MDFSSMDRFIDEIRKNTGTPGSDCIIYKEHKQIYRHMAGVCDTVTNSPMTGKEMYFLYSATKPITVTAVMQLVEKGLIGLNDPLYQYLPEFENMLIEYLDERGNVCTKPVETKITIRHLLSMSAGFHYNIDTPEIRQAQEKSCGSTREIVRAMAKQHLYFEPGTHWCYSICHDILGAVIEVASGMRLSEYIQINIFEVLGMKRSTFKFTDEVKSQMMPMYERVGGKVVKSELTNRYIEMGADYESGGAGVVSCIEDYILFTDAMANGGVGVNGGRILSSCTINLIRENQIPPEALKDIDWPQLQGYGYGLGVRTMIDKAKGCSLGPIGEFGWDGAKGVFLIIDPINHVSLVYAEQVGGCKDYLHPRLRNIMYACLGK